MLVGKQLFYCTAVRGLASDFPRVAELLKDKFQVISFHQRGMKKSPCQSKDYSMDAYVSDINCVAKFYGANKFHLWGHSWGGLYAQIYAEKYLDNLLSMFLCCPGSGTGKQWKEMEKEAIKYNKEKCTSAEWLQLIGNALLSMLGNDNANKRLCKQTIENYNKDFGTTIEKVDIDYDDIKASAIAQTRREIAKFSLLKRQENPPYRITIVYGDQDIFPSSKNFVLERYPTATIYTVRNSGHFPWLHNSGEFKEILNLHYS